MVLPAHRQTYPHTISAAFGREAGLSAPRTSARGHCLLAKAPKGSKSAFYSPAPSEKRRERFSTAPDQLRESPVLLMWAGCARPLFTLTSAAAHSRRRPARLEWIGHNRLGLWVVSICIGYENPRPASRGIFAQLEPRRRNLRPANFRLPRVRKREKALFAGKIPVSRSAAKCRPSFLAGKGFLPP